VSDEFVNAFLNMETAVMVAPMLFDGFRMTVKLVLSIVPAAMAFGLLIAVLRDLKIPGLNFLLIVYVDLLRSFPPLVLIIYLYAGLPFMGIELSEFGTVVIVLVANGAAFFGEIFRAGMEAVPKGQRDAARATGLSTLYTMVFVVVPQGVRKVIPPVASNMIELSKVTSLGSVVALPELLRSARMAQSIVYDATPLVMAAALYLLCLWPLVRLLSRLEQRLTVIASR